MCINFKGPIPPFFKHPSLAQVDFLSALLYHEVFSFRIDSFNYGIAVLIRIYTSLGVIIPFIIPFKILKKIMESAKTWRCGTVSLKFNDLKRFLLATPNTIWGFHYVPRFSSPPPALFGMTSQILPFLSTTKRICMSLCRSVRLYKMLKTRPRV